MALVASSDVLAAVGAVSLSVTSLSAFTYSPSFNITSVFNATQQLPRHSWEFGTFTQALIELYNPEISVFGDRPFPVPTLNRSSVRALAYLAPVVRFGSGYSALDEGNEQVGDAASMGVGALLLGKTEPAFANATNQTVDGLLNNAPRFWNGAISHRSQPPELWADFMYMVPPFLAYYAADRQDVNLLKETVRQCGLYRQVLKPNITDSWKGLWQHIAGPQNEDRGFWSTGNAWAAAGMTRVLATIMKSDWIKDAQWKHSAIDTLVLYIREILDGASSVSMDRGLLRNYLTDRDARGRGFGEVAGSALLAATAYRMAVLQPAVFDQTYVGWADRIRSVLGRKGNSPDFVHITRSGIARPVVNPYAWNDARPYPGASPEANSFVVLLYTAWRDCIKAGNCSPNAGVEFAEERNILYAPRVCHLRNSKRLPGYMFSGSGYR